MESSNISNGYFIPCFIFFFSFVFAYFIILSKFTWNIISKNFLKISWEIEKEVGFWFLPVVEISVYILKVQLSYRTDVL